MAQKFVLAEQYTLASMLSNVMPHLPLLLVVATSLGVIAYLWRELQRAKEELRVAGAPRALAQPDANAKRQVRFEEPVAEAQPKSILKRASGQGAARSSQPQEGTLPAVPPATPAALESAE